jgi:ribose transport system ATP-binding protein
MEAVRREDRRPAIPALEIENLSKRFGGATALDRVSLTVYEGEVHGLLGENGSGKSTLIKILAGFHDPEPGAVLRIHGTPISLPLAPGAFRGYGISFVHQNLGLIPSLTVVENLLIGELASRARWRIDWRKEVERARALFRRYRLAIDPSETVRRLSPVQHALLAIVRAFVELERETRVPKGMRLLVLDEPTPFLPANDVRELFRLVRQMVQEGASVIFVSHDVDEVMEITDRLTVLRDGRVAGTILTAEASKDAVVEVIIGRSLDAGSLRRKAPAAAAAAVSIKELRGSTVRNFSTSLRAGEVVGLTGLVGSGYEEILYAAYGAVAPERGRLSLHGKAYDLVHMSPARAIQAGCVLVPGDRQYSGAVSTLTMADNMCLPVLQSRFNSWLLLRRRIGQWAAQLAREYDVRPRDPELLFGSLSGGNQQKVLLAKWLQMEPKLILLDEPTQGVDVGARQQVFAAIRKAAQRGAAVLCGSSDFEQLATICDRVLVFNRGVVVAELRNSEITKPAIAEQCYRAIDDADWKLPQ